MSLGTFYFVKTYLRDKLVICIWNNLVTGLAIQDFSHVVLQHASLSESGSHNWIPVNSGLQVGSQVCLTMYFFSIVSILAVLSLIHLWMAFMYLFLYSTLPKEPEPHSEILWATLSLNITIHQSFDLCFWTSSILERSHSLLARINFWLSDRLPRNKSCISSQMSLLKTINQKSELLSDVIMWNAGYLSVIKIKPI